MQDKRKIYNIQGKNINSLKPSHMDGKHQSPPQISKSRRIKRFGESVGQLSLGVYIPHVNVPLLYMISQKVVSPLSMSHLLWKTEFLATEMALVLSHMRETLLNLATKSLMVCTIQRICEQQLAVAIYSTSVVNCAIKDCFWEDQQTREDPRKWQVTEVLFRSITEPAKSASE
jgi:hypothetical protein